MWIFVKKIVLLLVVIVSQKLYSEQETLGRCRSTATSACSKYRFLYLVIWVPIFGSSYFRRLSYISVIDEASDFKFGTQFGFAKVYYKIEKEIGNRYGLGEPTVALVPNYFLVTYGDCIINYQLLFT